MGYNALKEFADDFIDDKNVRNLKLAFCLFFPGILIFIALHKELFFQLDFGTIFFITLIINVIIYLFFNLISFSLDLKKISESMNRAENILKKEMEIREKNIVNNFMEQTNEHEERINKLREEINEEIEFLTSVKKFYEKKSIDMYFEFAIFMTSVLSGVILYQYFNFIIINGKVMEFIYILILIVVSFIIFFFKNKIKKAQ